MGQAPVRLKKEIDGFALNRVQYAIIAESWRLVKVGFRARQWHLGGWVVACVSIYGTFRVSS